MDQPEITTWLTAYFALVLASLALYECLTLGRFTRKCLKIPILFFTLLEILSLRLIQAAVPPKFVLLGSCQECGDCCTSILGSPPAWIRRSFLMRIYTQYHKIAHRFSVRATTEDGSVLFQCGYLQSDGRCSIYHFRPLLCRNYPLIPFYHEPKLLPGCSYSIAPRVVAEMKPHPKLPILNSQVAVHHPSAPHRDLPLEEDFHYVDVFDESPK